jgi:hypothetical protein
MDDCECVHRGGIAMVDATTRVMPYNPLQPKVPGMKTELTYHALLEIGIKRIASANAAANPVPTSHGSLVNKKVDNDGNNCNYCVL